MDKINLTKEQLLLALLASQGNAAAAQLLTMKDTLPATAFTPTHATGGVFTGPYERRVFNTQPAPKLGIIGVLKNRSSTTESPLQMILLNQGANAGSHPAAGSCAPCKIPGALAKGVYSYVWGQLCFSTEKVDVSDNRIGASKNRSDFRDFQLIGNPFIDNPAVPTPPASAANALNSELSSMMLRFQVGWMKEYGKLIWNGNPTNNSGRYKEFKGFKLLINTGYTDAETSGSLTAADSFIASYAGLNGGSAGTPIDLAATIVPTFIAFIRKMRNRADVRGLTVDGVVVMTTQLFYELSALWPCVYYTAGCNLPGSTTQFVNSSDQIKARDEMRSPGNEFLWVDGTKVPVILDDSINETALTAGDAGKFSTEIFWIPLKVQGVEATYLEHFDYANPYTQEIVRTMAQGGTFITTENGRFLWVRRQDGYCVSMDVTESPRLVMEAPFLAGRLNDIKYKPSLVLETGY